MEHQYSTEQVFQEEEYSFPYHYIAQYEQNFSECLADPWGINYVATIEYLLEQISKVKFSTAIDIGSGDCRFTKELSKRYPDKKVVGLDHSEKAIQLAKALNPKLTFITENILQPKIIIEAFDIGILMEVLEHIPKNEVRDFLSAVSNLLCDEGLLFITVPHQNKPLEDKHFQHFSVSTLTSIIDEFFVPIEIIPFEKKTIKKNIIDWLLINQFFILNNKKLLNFIYKYYKKKLFFVEDEMYCNRIFIIAKKRK